ncbi:MAG: hypothetical protein M1832_002106 [Thelocarpon impressellum]|nr:MAG: hypothetical protein M1832_002106 [Thelocarpon impressellum]
MTCDVRPPAYSPRVRDSDASSVRSAAPSYTSAAPSYRTSADASCAGATTAPRGLPAIPAAAEARRVSDLSAHAYTPSSPTAWSSPRSSAMQARHYDAVAARRASRDGAARAEALRQVDVGRAEKLCRGVVAAPPIPASSRGETVAVQFAEDPYVVGGAAAAQARAERLAGRGRTDETLVQEDKKWDFFVTQMADWDERERSWAVFKRRVEQKGRRRRWGL